MPRLSSTCPRMRGSPFFFFFCVRLLFANKCLMCLCVHTCQNTFCTAVHVPLYFMISHHAVGMCVFISSLSRRLMGNMLKCVYFTCATDRPTSALARDRESAINALFCQTSVTVLQDAVSLTVQVGSGNGWKWNCLACKLIGCRAWFRNMWLVWFYVIVYNQWKSSN